MGFKVLKKSRQRPEPGDIFVFQMSELDERYFWGRVIATDTTLGGFSDVTLIYLYRTTSGTKLVVPELRVEELLLPPIGTNTLGWSRGYFEVVGSRPLEPGDKLPQPCFKDSRGWYFDEYSKRLSGPTEPVGAYGLTGIAGIEEQVQAALGLPVNSAV
jgi:hypothetical protein